MLVDGIRRITDEELNKLSDDEQDRIIKRMAELGYEQGQDSEGYIYIYWPPNKQENK